jgi:hypothetical protein
MKKGIIHLVLLMIVTSSCKKKQDLPEQNSETPVFMISYLHNGLSQTIEAGNNDYFMTTSWLQDTNLVYVLRGDLAQTANAVSKGSSLSILLNDDHASTLNSAMNVDSILSLGSHLLNDKLILGTIQSISFKPSKAFKTNATYIWEVTDGQADLRTVNAYSFTADFPVGKTYSVILKYDDNVGGCATTHTNVFRVGNTLQTHITAARDTTVPEFKFNFSYPVPSPGGTYSCSWKFPDGSTSTMTKPSRSFQPGTYIISLRLVDLNTSDTCYSYYQLHVTDNLSCESNYSASFSPVINGNLFATATVLLTEPDGTVFSSRNVIQPESSNFEIISVSNYKTDARGNPTKSLNVKFNCLVQNGSRQINLTNASGIIAVAHKP